MAFDTERFMQFATRGMPRTKRGMIVFFGVQWSFVGAFIVYLFVVSSREGPDKVFSQVVVPLGIIFGVILLCVVVAFSATIPGRIRATTLRRGHPGRVVVTSSLSMWDREAISTMRKGEPTPRLLLLSAALAFDSDGVSVWTGVIHPQRIANLPWAEVNSIQVVDEAPTWIVISTLSIGSTVHDGDMQFTMFSRRRLGTALANRVELERLAAQLMSARAG